MNAFHYYYFFNYCQGWPWRSFWQLICYGKNEITKPFSTSRMMHRVASYYITVMWEICFPGNFFFHLGHSLFLRSHLWQSLLLSCTEALHGYDAGPWICVVFVLTCLLTSDGLGNTGGMFFHFDKMGLGRSVFSFLPSGKWHSGRSFLHE